MAGFGVAWWFFGVFRGVSGCFAVFCGVLRCFAVFRGVVDLVGPVGREFMVARSRRRRVALFRGGVAVVGTCQSCQRAIILINESINKGHSSSSQPYRHYTFLYIYTQLAQKRNPETSLTSALRDQQYGTRSTTPYHWRISRTWCETKPTIT